VIQGLAGLVEELLVLFFSNRLQWSAGHIHQLCPACFAEKSANFVLGFVPKKEVFCRQTVSI
jgi:uncharacterized protein (UPF0276 family)